MLPDLTPDTLGVMKRINALQLRQSLAKIMTALERSGEPILVERGRRPVGVLISLRDYEERFVEKTAAEARRRLLAEMDALARPSVDKTSGVAILRGIRDGA